MRFRLLAVFAAIAMLLSIVLPTAAFSAADTWTQVNTDGFGNDNNLGTWGVAVYDGCIYSGTWNPTNGCDVWKYDGTDWSQSATGGFDNANNLGCYGMAVYDGKLYAGTRNAVSGCEVLESAGGTWTQVNNDGFGNANNTGTCSLVVNDGFLYAGADNPTNGCEVWRYNGANWNRIASGGFGDANNGALWGMAVYNNQVYAGTENPVSGTEIWAYDGTNWTQVNVDGFGDPTNETTPCMAVYNGSLYAGTGIGPGNTTGTEVWKYDGADWTQANADGFGSGVNTDSYSMVVYRGLLYVGTKNFNFGAGVWSYDGNDWTAVEKEGFGDWDNYGTTSLVEYDGCLYAGTGKDFGGCEVWRTQAAQMSTFYLAEGYTGTDFQEYLCIGNASDANATADVTYMFPDGTTQNDSYNVNANSRFTVDVNSAVGSGKEVSVKVESECSSMVVERPMYFNYNGVYPGGHDAVAAPSPGGTWYFAEGTTLAGFDEYITVLNPNATPANLTFSYMIEGEGEMVVNSSVGANSRATFTVRDQVGDGKTGVSLKLGSDQPVVAERPLYFNYVGLGNNNWKGGHCVVGTNSPATDWYFAEGTTRSGFEEWLCMQNPSGAPITVTATYVLGEGQGDPVVKTYDIPAQERNTVSVNQELGADKDVSVTLTCETPFIAERPLYFNYNGEWPGGHDVLGANGTGDTWFFAEGYTGANFQEYLCIQNPGANDLTAAITYYPEGGAPIVKQHPVKANSRKTVNVNEDAGANLSISAKVTSDLPVVVERPMYFNFNGMWPGGHDVVGYAP